VAEKNPKNVIGIDFGTTNTYVTICPFGTRNKQPLHLAGKDPSIDTAILYSDSPEADPNVFPMIGENATVTFGQADEKDILKEGYRYHTNFKLEIVRSEVSRRCVTDFFKALDRDSRLNFTPLNASENRVIIGAPSQAGEEFKRTLAKAAFDAGFGKAEILDEPIGALLTDLGSRKFALSDVLAGYLVIDFGGGTTDFAYLKGGQVVRSWGNFELGGRLFDDLFFQWFSEQNPKEAKKLKAMRRDFYVWSYLCRRLKEDFSETILKNPKAVMKAEVGRFGQVSEMTREEFLARAGAYTPSESFLDYYKKIGVSLSPKFERGKVDLIAMFSSSLKEGLKDIKGLRAVSLSGGSSKWFFVKDICSEELGIGGDMILNTFNPFGAISEGLSILPAIREEFDSIIANVSAGKRKFVEEIIGHVASSLERRRKLIVSEILTRLYDDKITPKLRGYKGSDTNIFSIEKDIAKIIEDYDGELSLMVKESFEEEINSIKTIVRRKLMSWLSDHGLKIGTPEGLSGESPSGVVVDGSMVTDQLAGIMSAGMASVATTLTSGILASLLGGGGIALLGAGPHGLVAGVMGGLFLGGLGWVFGQDKLKEWAKKPVLPGVVLKMIASDRVISNIRNGLEESLNKQFGDFIKSFAVKLSGELDLLISEEIDNLGIINIF
jgi:hypothetical protein